MKKLLPNAHPKPKPSSPHPHQGLKRGELKRESEKHRVKRLAEGSKPRKPIAKVNVTRQAKRRKSYAQKLAAYKRSETYKIVEARAMDQCEFRTFVEFGFGLGDLEYRCGETDLTSRLHHHHTTYARFGGKERPSDIVVLCQRHHEQAESQHPTRNRNYSQSRSSLGESKG